MHLNKDKLEIISFILFVFEVELTIRIINISIGLVFNGIERFKTQLSKISL